MIRRPDGKKLEHTFMYDEKTENNGNSIGVIKTWVARTGHSLLATKTHRNHLVVSGQGGGGKLMKI